jgi:hypothetical protein
VATVLLDESTVRAAGDDWAGALGALVESAVAGTRFALLWRPEDAAETARIEALGVDQVIAKPIAGPALRDALYPIGETKRATGRDTILVSDAA